MCKLYCSQLHKSLWADSNIFEFFSVSFRYISWTVSIRSNKHRKSLFTISTLRKARVSKKLFHESTRTSMAFMASMASRTSTAAILTGITGLSTKNYCKSKKYHDFGGNHVFSQ